MADLEATIHLRLDWASDDLHAWGQNVIDAVMAVLKVHARKESRYMDGTPVRGEFICVECTRLAEDTRLWPCPTVRVIAEKLRADDE